MPIHISTENNVIIHHAKKLNILFKIAVLPCVATP